MPFLLPLLALIMGIFVGERITSPSLGIVPVLAGCGYYLFLIKGTSSPIQALKKNKKHKIWIFLIFFGIGIFDMGFKKPDSVPLQNLKNYVTAQGEIVESKESVSGDVFVVKIFNLIDKRSQSEDLHNFRILLSTDGLSAGPGDIITFPIVLTPIEDNPNFRASGYAARMRRAGITLKTFAKESDVIINGFNNSLANAATVWRNRVAIKLEKSSLSRDTRNFIIALLLGDRSFLSEDIRAAFSNAGVAHVLALSGLHVSIIMGIFLILLFPLKLLGCHNLRYWVAVLMIWCFAFLTGMSPSNVRACLMTTFVIAAVSLQRQYNAENALVASAFIILLVSPQSLYDVGFQLSFLCVGGILLFATQINPVNRHFHPYLHSFMAAILVSMVATVTTWVVVSYYFKSVPLLFLPVNLCMLPLLPFFILIVILYVFLLFWGFDSSFLSTILDKGYEFFNWIATNLSAHGSSAVSLNIQLPVVVLWLLGVLIIAYALKRAPSKRRKIIIGGGFSLLAISLICIPVFNKSIPDSIIFQKNYNEITVALYDGPSPTLSTMPRNAISRLYHKGCDIISVDCDYGIDSIATYLSKMNKTRRKKYLILGGGFNENSLKGIPFVNEFDKIILHSSLKRKMETKLKKEAFEMKLNTVYSLRDEGPLEEFLVDSLPATR